jgi:hypothetical protein
MKHYFQHHHRQSILSASAVITAHICIKKRARALPY